MIGVKYSVAAVHPSGKLWELACEGTGGGKFIKLTFDQADAQLAKETWVGQGFKEFGPSVSRAKELLSLLRPANGQIHPDALALLLPKKTEIKDWTDHGEKPTKQRTAAPKAASTPFRLEISDDSEVGQMPEPPYGLGTAGPRRYQVS